MPAHRRNSGFILIYAIIAMFLLGSLIVAGAGRAESMGTAANVHFASEGQARQVARSGLLHTHTWLRAQERQPVTDFAPQRDLNAVPPVDETDDPSIGLVRAFEISPGVWGRYTVHRGVDDEPFTDSNRNGVYDPGEAIVDLDGDGYRTMGHGARDISARHGVAPGSVWRIESMGEIFVRPRADLPLGTLPNRRVAGITLASNVSRAGFSMPATAALITTEAEEVKLKSKVRITSPTLGIGYRKNTGSPDVHSKAVVEAPTTHAALAGLREGAFSSGKGVDDPLQVEEVFGVDLPGMKAIADIVRNVGKDAHKNEPPITVPDGAIVVITPEASKSKKKKGLPGVLKLKSKWQATGRGILIIDGDVETKLGLDFEGILFITGNVKWDKSYVTGMVAAAGNVEIAGKPKSKQPNRPAITHDPDLVASLLGFTGEYRVPTTVWKPSPLSEDGRPLEGLEDAERPSTAEAPHEMSDAGPGNGSNGNGNGNNGNGNNGPGDGSKGNNGPGDGSKGNNGNGNGNGNGSKGNNGKGNGNNGNGNNGNGNGNNGNGNGNGGSKGKGNGNGGSKGKGKK